MGRFAWLLVLGAASATAGACTALSGADALAVDDRAIAAAGSASGGTSGASSSSGSTTSSASSSSSGTTGRGPGGTTSSASSSGNPVNEDAAPPIDPDVVFRETFASEAACSAWGSDANKAVWNPAGHDGAGSCSYCGATAGPPYIAKSVIMPRAGRVSISVWLKGPGGEGTAPASIGFALVGGASIMTGMSATTTWTEGGGASAGVQPGTAVEVRLGVDPNGLPGQCVSFDDVVVFVR